MPTELSRAARLKLLRDRLAMHESISEGERQLLEEAMQIVERFDVAGDASFAITTVVSRQGVAVLDVEFGGVLRQVTPTEARQVARMLVEQAAIVDAEVLIMQFAQQKMGVSPGQAMAFLNELRTLRQELQHAIDEAAIATTH